MNGLISSKEGRSTCIWVTISTIIYLIIFPIFFTFSLFSFMVFDKPYMPTFLALLFVFLSLCIPLSIPVSIFFMWCRYFQRKYSKACFHCGVPILTAIVNFVLGGFLEFFFEFYKYYLIFNK